jgi:hypothetical protein
MTAGTNQEWNMRTMLQVRMPTEAGNRAIKDGVLQKTLENAMSELHPEAAYFTSVDGWRTALFVFDMKDPSQLATISEPFFMNLNAEVTYQPCMNAEDLKKGLSKIR